MHGLGQVRDWLHQRPSGRMDGIKKNRVRIGRSAELQEGCPLGSWVKLQVRAGEKFSSLRCSSWLGASMGRSAATGPISRVRLLPHHEVSTPTPHMAATSRRGKGS